MKKIMLMVSLSLLTTNAFSAVIGVNQILITSSTPTYIQVSEVEALSGGVDVATASNGAVATDDGTGFWPGSPTPDTSFAIDGSGPADFPNIYHSDTDGAGEFLLITLDDSYTIDALSIFGRADSFSFRDVYDVQLLDGDGQVLFSALAVSANNVANEAVVEVVPIPAAVWLFASALGLLGWMRRRST